MRDFDEKKLIVELTRLTPALRVAFAAACAERQMLAYRSFARAQGLERPEMLDQSLDDAWSGAATGNEAGLERQLERCMALIPDEHAVTPWTAEANYAQDAAMSVAYTLRAGMSGDPQEAAWAARHAWECLWQYVIDKEQLDINQPRHVTHVLSHPLLQVELARQQRDLDELLGVSSLDAQHAVAKLRDRAKLESAVFFGASL